MLPLSLDCPFLIASTVFSHVYLCCHCLWIVHSWLPLQFPLTFIYVVNVSWLSILDCPYSFLSRLFMFPLSLDCPFLIAPSFLWRLFMLPLSLDCPFLIAPTVSSDVYLCCHCLCIVHSWLPLQFPLTFIYVVNVSWLSILDCLYSFLSRLFMLPLSLYCPFLIAPTVSSHVYLCFHCLWIVHSWLPLQFPLTFIYVSIVSGLSILDCPYSFLSRLFMLPLSLDCPFLITLQFSLTFLYVAIVSGLSILDCPYSFLSRLFMLPLSLDCTFLIAPTVFSHVYLCCHCLWIVHSWLPLQFPLTLIYVAIVSWLSILDCSYSFLSRLFMLPLSLDCSFLITLQFSLTFIYVAIVSGLSIPYCPYSFLSRLFMLPLSLDCQFLIAPTVSSHVYLCCHWFWIVHSWLPLVLSGVYLCCHCLWIVHSWLPLQFFLTFIYVAIVSGLSILDCPYSFRSHLFAIVSGLSILDCPYSFLWRLFMLPLSGLFIRDCPYSFLSRLFMLPLSLDCLFLIVPTVFSHVYLCCHCLLIVHSWFPLQFPLTLIYVAIVSRLSILDCLYSFLSRLFMLPLSLDCPFLIAPTVSSHDYLCCHCLWIFHSWLPLQFYLEFIYVAIVSGLSILDFL